jgi:thioredoxin-related protein
MNTQASNHATKKDRRPSSVVIVLLGLSFFLFVEVVFLLLRQVSSTSDLQRANELLAEQSKYLMMHSKSKVTLFCRI